MDTIIILLALFGVKHFLADFVLQFPYMLSEKGIYGAQGGLDHAWIHGIFTAAIIGVVFTNPMLAVICGTVDSVLHYHIDWCKQQLSRGTTPTDRKFWLLLGADQGLHYLTYVGIIALVVL